MIERTDNTFKFALAQSNPFRVPGIFPNCFRPVAYSHCVSAILRGTGTIGTAGVGWVLMNPTYTNNTNMVVCSGVTSTETTTTGINVTDGGVLSFTCSSLPYSTSQITTALAQGRICGAGIRVRYSGKQINMAGSRWHVKGITSTSLAQGTMSLSNLISRVAGVRAFANDRRWSHSAFDFYDDTSATFGITETEWGAQEIVLMTGTPGENFDFEAIVFAEFVGTQQSAIVQADLLRHKGDTVLAEQLIDKSIGNSAFPEEPATIERLLRIYRSMVSGRSPNKGGKVDLSSILQGSPF